MRQWKVGAITGGILLIAIGALWLLQSFLPISFAKILLYSWPVICIFLGIEILTLHFLQKEQKLSVHWMSIILLVFIGGISLLFNMGQLAMDELGFSFQTSSYELSETLSPTSTIEEVIITVPNYHVTITGTDEQTVDVEGSVQAHMKNEALLKEQFDNAFSVRQIKNKVYIEVQELSDFTNNITGTLHMTVPENANITVTSGHGNISLTNVNGSASLETNYGNITARQFTGSFIAHSYGGNIQITDSSLAGNSVIESSGGNVILDLKRDNSLDLQATVQNGEIKGNVDWKITSSENEMEETQMKGTTQIGDGEHSIILVNNSGNIVVNQ